MKPQNLLVTIILALSSCNAPTTSLLGQLEEELTKRPVHKTEKERYIDKLKTDLKEPELSAQIQMFLCEELYEQYATFQFDSAMSVVRKQKELAASMGDQTASFRAELHRVMLYATAGYFSELRILLDSLPAHKFPTDLKLEYFETAEWTYNRMADYLSDNFYSPEYRNKGHQFQDSILSVLPEESPEYHYWKGCRLWNVAEPDSVIAEFMQTYERTEPRQRLYARATYNLSWMYEKKGDKVRQKEFLIRAAISDQIAQLKESLALQELALLLKTEGDEVRASRYLSLAMEDAKFYGNRLRMLEIAQKIPAIVIDYEKQLERANYRRNIVIVTVSILTLLLAFVLFALSVSMKRLQAKRILIQKTSDELKAVNNLMEQTNQKLNAANTSLQEQKRLRESCINLFIELTAVYIDKFNSFQMKVKHKVKANQTADLLQLVSPSRMNERDANEFFMNFDRAFLSTFPNFIENINTLLRPEERFILPDKHSLNFDLRILAFVRFGIKSSAQIATLLNCSQQTVCNHRSLLKSRALVKETFDYDIMQL